MTELRVRQANLPPLHPVQYVPPAPQAPPPQPQPNIDLHAAARQRDERWALGMRDRWRNEHEAQQQLQHDEEEEEWRRWREERELIRRQQILEEVTNNASGHNLAAYNASNAQEPPPPPPPPHLPFRPIITPQLQPPPPEPIRNARRIRVPRARTVYQDPATRHSLGPMTIQCPQCDALHFAAEKLSISTRNIPKFGMCCLTGQIVLPPFPPPPQDLRHLFDGTSPHSQEFKTNIRQYNSTFAFTSLGVKVDHSVTAGSGPYSFRISGELHHLSGSLLPLPNHAPVFAQIYIHDPNEQLAHRQGNNDNLNPAVMAIIQGVLDQSHPYVELYKQAYRVIREKPAEEQNTVVIRLRAERNQDLRRYNLPTANNEVAAVIPGDGSEERSDHRDIILRLRDGGLKRISHLHPSYSTLHYVLLFPHGEDGWHPEIPAHFGINGKRRAQHVTQRCYHAYRLHPRPGDQPLLLRAVNLFQQYVVDAWASVEQNNLNWVKYHQKELRADVYSGLRDAALGDRNDNINLAEHGSRIILPSTFIGSEHHMNQLFQDSMAICRALNKPDIFLTMTANPKIPNWPEIQDQLLWEVPPAAGANHPRRKQKASDRPDIVARVFEEKKNALLKEIHDGVLGRVAL
jgi:Helitron helicase-like domain at N-terminus